MSRRKQAKPRAVLLKPHETMDGEQTVIGDENEGIEPPNSSIELEPVETTTSTNRKLSPEEVVDDGGSDDDEDPSDSIAGSSEGGFSWTSSEAGDEVSSLSPRSPSGGDEEGTEVTFTLGPTEATPYACHFCEKAFPRLSYLKKHEQSHSDEMPFQCDFCQRLFKHKRSRDRHVKLHTGDRKYRCPHCESAFSRSDHLKIHMKTHDHQKPYQCVVCNRGYNTAAALTSHMQNHKKDQSQVNTGSSPTPPNFRCLSCTGTFVTGEELQAHTAHHHPQQLTPPPSSSSSSTVPTITNTPTTAVATSNGNGDLLLSQPKGRSPTVPPSTSTFSCLYCTKDGFGSLESLHKHIRRSHGLLPGGQIPSPSSTTSSPLDSTTSSSSARGSVAGSSPFPCDFCRMEFSSLGQLESHRGTTHGLTAYLEAKAKENAFCPTCAIAFPNALAYAEHFILTHTNPQLKQIQQTVVSSPEPPQLKPTDLSKKKSKVNDGSGNSGSKSKTSREKSPGGTKRNPTGTTDKRRRTGGNHSNSSSAQFLPNATATITDSLLCNQCSAGFGDFESFRAHLRTHIEETLLPRKFSCDECEEEFSNEECLETHATGHFLSTATEYGCTACRKLYTKPDELQKHLMDIHAHHLFRCALCKELFDSKVSIQVHFAVAHSNEAKLYRCSPCAAVFTSQIEFQVHVKMAHLRRSSPYRCLLCNSSFSTELDLQFHLSTHQKPFRCKLCDEAFHVEFLLDRHVQNHHHSLSSPSPIRSPHQPPQDQLSQSTPNGNKLTRKGSKVNKGGGAKCEICDEGFTGDSELVLHRKQVHHLPASPKTLTPPPSTYHQASSKHGTASSRQQNGTTQTGGHQTLSLLCAYCNENCKSRSDLENHMKSHTVVSTGRQKCNICDEVCPTATLLAEHKLTHCKVLTGSMCIGCKTSLESEEEFYAHMKQHAVMASNSTSNNNNNALIPSPCVVCRQTLMSDIEVHIHAKFHTKDSFSTSGSAGLTNKHNRPACCLCFRIDESLLLLNSQSGAFICADCLRKTSSLLSPTMAKGISSILSPPNPSPPTGSASGSVFINGSLQGRKSYQCIKCQQTFGSEEEIQVHVTTHLLTEGSLHECHLCTAKHFDSPLKLQTHLIEHTFEGCPSFRCYICSTLFTTAIALQKHILTHGHSAAPYDCPNCQLKFFFRAELENHSHHHTHQIQSKFNVNSEICSNGTTVPGSRSGSNQSSQSEIHSLRTSSKAKRKRKKFFYRSDDSDEEMEVGKEEICKIKVEVVEEVGEITKKEMMEIPVDDDGGSSDGFRQESDRLDGDRSQSLTLSNNAESKSLS